MVKSNLHESFPVKHAKSTSINLSDTHFSVTDPTAAVRAAGSSDPCMSDAISRIR